MPLNSKASNQFLIIIFSIIKMYLTYTFIILLLLSIVVITTTLMATEDPEFSAEKSENFNNVTHFNAVYKDKPMMVALDFEWVKFNGLQYYKSKTRTYENKEKNKILKLNKHPFYYIDKPVFSKQTKKQHNIPKIIWQTMRELPKEGTSVYDAVQTFKAQEGWVHRFVTDENAKVFLKENFDEDVLHAFEVLVPGAFKADLLRACLLYVYGGVYADSKLFLHYDLDSFLEGDLVLAKEKGKAWGIWNGFMAAIPKQKYFKNVIDNIVDNVSVKFYGDDVLDITGPRLYGRSYISNFNCNDIVEQSNVTLLKANHILNDGKDYINSKNNQELFMTWDAKQRYRKFFGDGYDYLWKAGKTYNLNLHSKVFSITSGELKYFNKTKTTLNFLWSKGLHKKDKYSLEPTESHSSNFNLKNDVIWVRMGSNGKKTDINQFSKMLHKIKTPKILVTSDGDMSMPSELNKVVFNKIISHPNIKVWYTQNYDGTSEYSKLKHYPIGLDLHTPKHGLNTPVKRINTLLDIRNKNKSIVYKIFCDLHLSQNNKFNNERKRFHNMLKDKKHVDFLNKRISQTEIWENYSKYEYTISTHGNGLDCHRTWEIILLGGTVVTKTSSLDPLFKDLPVIIVKDWNECTMKNLALQKDKFRNKMSDEHILKVFTYDYWIN